MTYFNHESAAARYACARPYFHPVVVQRIRGTYGVDWPVARALDMSRQGEWALR